MSLALMLAQSPQPPPVGLKLSLVDILNQEETECYQNILTVKARDLNDGHKRLISQLVRKSLNEELKDDYFDGISASDATVYIDGEGEGFAVAINHYLDLFGVTPARQRNGTGKNLLKRVFKSQYREQPMLYWRSQPKRIPANEWYSKIANKSLPFVNVDKIGFIGYFIGMYGKESSKALSYMQQKPSNFKR